MAIQTCMGAMLTCSFGAAPATLTVLPQNGVVTPLPAANVMDHVPLLNILPFGVCSSPANPMVAAATAAALGVLTPMPCLPATAGPWLPGCPQVLIGGMPALDNSSMLTCNWGGVITITNPGQTATLSG